MHLVMFVKDKQPRAGVIDGEDIVDINAGDRSLPTTLKGILEAECSFPGQESHSRSRSIACRADAPSSLPPISNPGLLLSVRHELPRAPEGDEDAGAGEAGRVHQERGEHHRLRPADPAARRRNPTWSTGKASSPW